MKLDVLRQILEVAAESLDKANHMEGYDADMNMICGNFEHIVDLAKEGLGDEADDRG